MSALHPYVMPFLYGFGSLIVAVLGRHRKWGFWGYFWASLLMSPILGLLFVLAGDAPPKRRNRPEPSPKGVAPSGVAPSAPSTPVAAATAQPVATPSAVTPSAVAPAKAATPAATTSTPEPTA